jgi:hypothetical protein
MLDYEDNESESKGLELTIDNVTIKQVGADSEVQAIFYEDGINHSWIFEVSSTVPKTLQSIVLLDIMELSLEITHIELKTSSGLSTIPIKAKSEQGIGYAINQAIFHPNTILVKIDLVKRRRGLIRQCVLFNFGTFYMMRCISVGVYDKDDKSLISLRTSSSAPQRKENNDLFWDQNWEIIQWEEDVMESSDYYLDEYALPKKVEEFIEEGKYKNVEKKVSKFNYVRRMHNLLYLEEYQQRKDLSRYDLLDIKVDVKDLLEGQGELINDPRYSFITVEMNEVLFEGGRSIRKGDHCLMKPNNQDVIHQCQVHAVHKEFVVIKLTKRAKEACLVSRCQCSFRFSPSRVPLRAMHQAIDNVDLDVIFPDIVPPHDNGRSVFDHVTQCMRELEKSSLNEDQKKAIISAIDPTYINIPTLVLGPFGCGKTRTLIECVSLLTRHQSDARVLICTHNNSAADIYVEYLHQEWLRLTKTRPNMYRLYFKERKINTISQLVASYCHFVYEANTFLDMTADQILSHSIVVTTTMEARSLFLKSVPKGSFTHIFIDEAAQVFEPELLISLCLCGKKTKVILAGDTMQTDPPVSSSIAKQYGLGVSLLERLYDTEFYKNGHNCKIHLTENHRSHEQIMSLPSKLFYDNTITCKAVFPPDGPKEIPPLQFIGVDGQEKQDEASPSFYNTEEVTEVDNQVGILLGGGGRLKQSDVCVLCFYNLQVQHIRSQLRKKGRREVQVCNIGGIQGREYRALIISTVRTCNQEQDENDEGFLNNIKLFNTAITRAKEWLVIIGDPITLCSVGYNSMCWTELIKQCIDMKTFSYNQQSNTHQFINNIENKVFSRKMCQNVHKELLDKANNELASTIPVSKPVNVSSTVSDISSQLSGLNITEQHRQNVNMKVLTLMMVANTDIAMRITDEIFKLDQTQLAKFVTDDVFAKKYVREIENVLSRNGPTSILMFADRLPPFQPQVTQPLLSQPTPNMVAEDLPMFLKTQVDSLTQHYRFCDSQQNIKVNEMISKNLMDQKNLLKQQMQLLNEQINKYREYVNYNKLPPPPSSEATPLATTSVGVVPQRPHPQQPLLPNPYAPSYHPLLRAQPPVRMMGGPPPAHRGGILPTPQQPHNQTSPGLHMRNHPPQQMMGSPYHFTNPFGGVPNPTPIQHNIPPVNRMASTAPVNPMVSQTVQLISPLADTQTNGNMITWDDNDDID